MAPTLASAITTLGGEAEAWAAVGEELRQLSGQIRKQWQHLEDSVSEKEAQVFVDNWESLQKSFGLTEADIDSTVEGGLRAKVRDRIQKLVLAPILDSLRQYSHLVAPAESGNDQHDESKPVHPVHDLLCQWESAEKLLCSAVDADAKFLRRSKRMERMNAEIAKEVKAEEAPKLHLIWAPVQDALEKLLEPARSMAVALKTHSSADSLSFRVASSLPAIVARSVCDWYFQRYSLELEQLENWWTGARSALQRRPKLWDAVVEAEAIFVRRIERGIEEMHTERTRYLSFATFGASCACSESSSDATRSPSGSGAWPETSVTLVAQCIIGMRRRLGPIRDSAAWRVMDTAKTLQAQMLADGSSRKTPWQCVGSDEGIAALCEALAVRAPPASSDWANQTGNMNFQGSDPSDAALVFMQRLDNLLGLVADLKDLPDVEGVPDTGGLSYIFEEVTAGLSYLNEELLSVLDECDGSEPLSAWSKDWVKWGEAIGGQQLDSAMERLPLKQDLPASERPARRRRLALMRGMQILLNHAGLRRWLLAAPSANSQTNSAAVTFSSVVAVVDEVGLEVLTLCEPPAPAPAPTLPASRSKPASTHEKACSVDGGTAKNDPVTDVDAVAEALTEAGVEAVDPRAADQAIASSDACGVAAVAVARPQDVDVAGMGLATPLEAATAWESGHLGIAKPAPSASSTTLPFRDQPTQRLTTAAVERASRAASAKETRHTAGSSESASPAPSTGCLSRPVTPSWLEPPWPRPDTGTMLGAGGFSCGLRPDTPSTVCDDAELAPLGFGASSSSFNPGSSLPRWKCVDGQFVPLRASSTARLPPIQVPGGGLSSNGSGSRRPAW